MTSIEPQWQDDGIWMLIGNLQAMFPLNEPFYPVFLKVMRWLFGGFTDGMITATLAVQHAVFSLALYSFATFFRTLSSRLIAALVVVFPGSMLWIVNGVYKQSFGVSFVLLTTAILLRLTGRETRRPIHWAALFGALYLAIVTRYPTAVLTGIAPLAFLLRFAALPTRSALKPFFYSIAHSGAVLATAVATYAGVNLWAGNPAFLATSGMIVPFKLATFQPSKEELDALTLSAMASVDDPMVRAVIPLIGRDELLKVPGGMVRAIELTVKDRFGMEIGGEGAERLMSEAGAAILSSSVYWRQIWDARSIFKHLFSDGRISSIISASNGATRRFLAGDRRNHRGRVVGPISSLSEASIQRNLESLTSLPVSLAQLRWHYGFEGAVKESQVHTAAHVDFRFLYFFVFAVVLFVARTPYLSTASRVGLVEPQIAIALCALAYIVIMGTIHIFTVQYSMTSWVLIHAIIASQAAIIDWRAVFSRLRRRARAKSGARLGPVAGDDGACPTRELNASTRR